MSPKGDGGFFLSVQVAKEVNDEELNLQWSNQSSDSSSLKRHEFQLRQQCKGLDPEESSLDSLDKRKQPSVARSVASRKLGPNMAWAGAFTKPAGQDQPSLVPSEVSTLSLPLS